MPESAITHSTFVLERNYPATPDRIFAAFADPSKKRRWFLESHGNEIEKYELDFRVGGKEQAIIRFKKGSPIEGKECRNDTIYLDIVPNHRVAFASAMAISGQCISTSLATFELLPAENGTDVIFTHQGAFFEGADGPQMREDGWRKLLDRFAEELAR